MDQEALVKLSKDMKAASQTMSRNEARYLLSQYLTMQDNRKAADQNDPQAQFSLAYFYQMGRGVKQDPAKALFWMELAAAGGHPLAPLLRDQHYTQLKDAVRERVAAEATNWQARHPHQMNCKFKHCIYATWTKRPVWNMLQEDQYYP